MQHLSSCPGSFSVMPSRLIHVVTNGRISTFIRLNNNIPFAINFMPCICIELSSVESAVGIALSLRTSREVVEAISSSAVDRRGNRLGGVVYTRFPC